MKFTSRYEGKKHLFYIQIDKKNEFELLQPYFLATSYDHPRKGRINYMDCLFSGAVWCGSCRHGYGYSVSADVYGSLYSIIREMYKNKIVDGGPLDNFLSNWNTHDNDFLAPDEAMEELRALNDKAMEEKFNF